MREQSSSWFPRQLLSHRATTLLGPTICEGSSMSVLAGDAGTSGPPTSSKVITPTNGLING